MSIRIMTWALDQAPVNDSSQLLVLLCLSDWADDNGVCWPSVERVAERARCSESTARRRMRQLQAAGLLEVNTASNGRASNVYRIITTSNPVNVTPPVNMTPFAGPATAETGVINSVNLTPCQSDRVHGSTLSAVTPNPVSGDTPTLSAVTPEPSMNPQEPPAAVPSIAEQIEEAAAAANLQIEEIERRKADRENETLARLEAAVRAEGLTARFDRINDADRAKVQDLAITHGVSTLAAVAKAQHRADDPARFVQAWIPAWVALPPAGYSRLTAPRQACNDCDNGWLDAENACPTCRPNLCRTAAN